MTSPFDPAAPRNGYSLALLLRHFVTGWRDIRLTVREMQAAPISEPWRLFLILLTAAATVLDQAGRALHIPTEFGPLVGLDAYFPPALSSRNPLLLYPLDLIVTFLIQAAIYYVGTFFYRLVLKLMRSDRPWREARTGYVAPEPLFIGLLILSTIVSLALYAVYGPLGRPNLRVFLGLDGLMGIILLAYSLVAMSEALAITAGRAFGAMILAALAALLVLGIGYGLFEYLAPSVSGAILTG